MAHAERITFAEYRSRFATEADCREYLFQIRFPEGFVCPKCGCTEYYPIRTRHIFEAMVTLIAVTFHGGPRFQMRIHKGLQRRSLYVRNHLEMQIQRFSGFRFRHRYSHFRLLSASTSFPAVPGSPQVRFIHFDQTRKLIVLISIAHG